MAEDKRTWQTVLEHVETSLLAGTLAPGDRLPGERALAGELGVGRSSVREALRVLEVLGLIRTSSGSGPNSGAMIVATPRGAMSALLRLQVAASGFDMADIVATRLVLEASVAQTLAGQDEPRLDPAESLLAAMRDETLSTEEFLSLDAAFHLSLAEATGNAVIAATMAGLREAIESYVQRGSSRIADWPATAGRLRKEHAAVINDIRAGKAAAAKEHIENHIRGYYAQITT